MSTLGASFKSYQPGSSEVPHAEALVIAVQTTTGEPADVQRGRADAADIGAVVQYHIDAFYHVGNSRFLVGESGSNNGSG